MGDDGEGDLTWGPSRATAKSRLIIANFTGFEADLLRSLASQIVELLRNEAAVPDDSRDPFEAMMDFSGPTSEPEDPVLQRLFPTAYTEDEEAAARVPPVHRGQPARRQGGRGDARSSTASRRPGCRPSSTEDGLMIDVELDEPTAETWMRSFTDIRLALATRLGVEDGDEEIWHALRRRRSARPRRTTSTSGSAGSRRRSSRRLHDVVSPDPRRSSSRCAR